MFQREIPAVRFQAYSVSLIPSTFFYNGKHDPTSLYSIGLSMPNPNKTPYYVRKFEFTIANCISLLVYFC